MRLLSLLALAGGVVFLAAAVVALQHDRRQLNEWDRVFATVDSTAVRRMPPSGINRGQYVPVLYLTWTHRGKTYRAATWEPVWARRTRAKAREDAAAASRRGKEEILVDPYEEYHISGRPSDSVYYYRDAWQRAAVGIFLVLVGLALRRGTPK